MFVMLGFSCIIIPMLDMKALTTVDDTSNDIAVPHRLTM